MTSGFKNWPQILRGRNGGPLQHSCLGNPTERGDWQALLHGPTKSRTWRSERTQRLSACLACGISVPDQGSNRPTVKALSPNQLDHQGIPQILFSSPLSCQLDLTNLPFPVFSPHPTNCSRLPNLPVVLCPIPSFFYTTQFLENVSSNKS